MPNGDVTFPLWLHAREALAEIRGSGGSGHAAHAGSISESDLCISPGINGLSSLLLFCEVMVSMVMCVRNA
jgi:hypothetical protein